MDSRFNQFIDQKYLSLETYKRDNTPIQTPVWFVIDNDQLYITTKETTGKELLQHLLCRYKVADCLFYNLLHTTEFDFGNFITLFIINFNPEFFINNFRSSSCISQ